MNEPFEKKSAAITVYTTLGKIRENPRNPGHPRSHPLYGAKHPVQPSGGVGGTAQGVNAQHA